MPEWHILALHTLNVFSVSLADKWICFLKENLCVLFESELFLGDGYENSVKVVGEVGMGSNSSLALLRI